MATSVSLFRSHIASSSAPFAGSACTLSVSASMTWIGGDACELSATAT